MSTEYCETLSGYRSFTSCIWLSEERATRTVVFDRGTLPGTSLDERTKKAIADAAVLMVDGNDLDAAVVAAKIARENGTKVLYDAGGLYAGVERLLPLADYLIPSEEFALRMREAERTFRNGGNGALFDAVMREMGAEPGGGNDRLGIEYVHS